MLKLLSNLFGKKSDKDIKLILPLIDKIKEEEKRITKLSNDELRQKTIEFKQKISDFIKNEESQIESLKAKTNSDDVSVVEKEEIWSKIDKIEKEIVEKIEEILKQILPQAFAVMRETARRFKENEVVKVRANERDKYLATKYDNISIVDNEAHYSNSWMAGGAMIKWDMVHYDVQLIGGIVLHEGKISEMATGEGKTLVGTLPIYLNALPGRGVHVVTVNDYLAKRDSEWMGMLMEFHGLVVDCIDKHEPNSENRRKAYLADVTYGTNNEFGFDYLRDNMATEVPELVQRKHNYAIVDEVDSVLIDDARTPLIISGPTPKGDDQEFDQLKPHIQKIFNAQRNLVNQLLADAKNLLKNTNDSEKEKEGYKLLFRAFRGLPKNKAIIKFLSEPGVKVGMQKTENFYMQDQMRNMHIIDDELYFVIEEKQNSIQLTDKGYDLLTEETGDPKFYILPDMGSVLADLEKSTKTKSEIAEIKSDLMREFAMKTDRVHTMNQLLKAYTLFERDVEYVVMDNKIKIVDEQTGRILDGRRYSDGLHQAIEAKENVKVEAATQTYATITLQNYFRMYSKLAGMTGTAETEAGEFWDIYKLDVTVIPTNKPITRADKDDLVFKTVREKYNAVIDDIEKLVAQGRPVLVGTTSVEISELLSRMLKMKKIPHNVLNAKLHQKEADIVAEAGKSGAVTIATNMAGRGTDIKLGQGVREAGGLAIIGTERHESRRVDRQLRGRAGRQGDPGTSQFYVSLEDSLMRLFGSERIAKVMDRLGLEEGEVIQHSMISKSIERAQRKVEENNFGVRKRLLEYDDVMNAQREVIYRKRRNALYGDRLSLDTANMMYDLADSIVEENMKGGDFENFNIELMTHFGIESPVSEKEFIQGKIPNLTDTVFDLAYENYKTKSTRISTQTLPVIEDVYKNQGSIYNNIAIPVTDGIKTINIIANLKNSVETKGKTVVTAIEKIVTLKIIDNAWKEHLREMDDLKQSVQNASYEQKDPLLIYKLESFQLFTKMIERINREITSYLVMCDLPENKQVQVQKTLNPAGMDFSKMRMGRTEVGAGETNDPNKFGHRTQEKQVTQPIRVEKKVGRNDPCPCGSGKKYKHCHGVEE